MSKRTLRIVSWNVNGIRAVFKKGFIEWFSKDSPDILCLQETKAYPEQLGEEFLAPHGYKSFWNNSEKKGYAGVCVYSKKEPLSAKNDFSRSGFDTEGRILILYYDDFLVLNVYFPNGRMNEERLKYKLEFYERFLKFVDGLKNRNIVICGDLNTAHKSIDLSRPGPNEMFSGFLPEEREWMDKFISHGYIDTFRCFEAGPGHYTWWDQKSRARERNVGWRIDYFFVTPAMLKRVKKAFILSKVQGSDHCPVGIELAA